MKAMMILGGAVLLSGCVKYPYDDDYARLDTAFPTSRICENVDFSQFIGHTASQEMAAAIINNSNAGLFRWISADGVATADYRPERVNATLDANNRITDVRCDAEG